MQPKAFHNPEISPKPSNKTKKDTKTLHNFVNLPQSSKIFTKKLKNPSKATTNSNIRPQKLTDTQKYFKYLMNIKVYFTAEHYNEIKYTTKTNSLNHNGATWYLTG